MRRRSASRARCRRAAQGSLAEDSVTRRHRMATPTGNRMLRGRPAFSAIEALMKAAFFYRLLDLLDRDEGQGMVEYALILVLIAVVVIAVLIVLGNQVQNVFCNISGGLGM